MYVRPHGSTGGYTQVAASQASDVNGVLIAGAYFIDLTNPPFSTPTNPDAAAGTSWDVVYVATNASGQVVDTKEGTVTFNSSNPPAIAMLRTNIS